MTGLIKTGVVCVLVFILLVQAGFLPSGSSAAESIYREEPEIMVEVRIRAFLDRNLKEDEPLFITGNLVELGEWRPDKIKMHRTGEREWVYIFRAPAGTKVEYKITRGSWETQAIYEDTVNERAPSNRVFLVSVPPAKERLTTSLIDKRKLFQPVPDEKTFQVGGPEGSYHAPRHIRGVKREFGGDVARFEEGCKIVKWFDMLPKPPSRITGDLRYHEGFKSRILGNSRNITVWLPPSYRTSPEKKYPVLYMHDGQNLFDAATSFTGVEWGVDETATRLIEEGKLQEIIVVGIANTSDRMKEYNPFNDKGRSYMKFIIEELKPFIDARYRTLPDRENTAVMGSSMGGIMSFMIVFSYPDIFSKAGCLSNSFQIEDGKIFNFLENAVKPPFELKIYIDCGDRENGIAALHKKVVKKLEEKKFFGKDNLMFYLEKGGEHNEEAWARRLEKPLLFLFSK